MIEKLNAHLYKDTTDMFEDCREKINELVDAVNDLDGLIGLTNNAVQALAKENNIHEKQIDELQMKLEPEKCERADLYAEQRKWIGKLCRFRDNDDDKWNYSTLKSIININCSFPFKDAEDYEWAICEPVKPDDDIIYKGGDNEL